jgi:hypothetical protein
MDLNDTGTTVVRTREQSACPQTTTRRNSLGISNKIGLLTSPHKTIYHNSPPPLSSLLTLSSHTNPISTMAPSDRISQISSHLNYPRGLLYGQLAIVTGAGQGIGAETARLFANEGAKVIISDIDAEKASTVANAINNNGGKALAVVGDMLDDAYLKTLVEKAAEFGEGKIHIIVNNAGFTWDGVIHKVCFSALLLP